MELEEIVHDLCRKVPEAIGAVLCDFEGESVVSAVGSASLPTEAENRAFEHVPRSHRLTVPVREFLVRLGGAEPCAVLRMFDETMDRRGFGALDELEVRYSAVDMLVKKLPFEFYMVLFLRRPAVMASARRCLREAGLAIQPHLA